MSDAVRERAERARREAAALPSGADVLKLTADAIARQPADLSPAQIRQLGAAAVAQAQEISYLLGKLAGLGIDGIPARAGDRRGN